MHQLYYVEEDPIKAIDSVAIFNQIKAIPAYLQLLCNAHHQLPYTKEMPYKPLMVNGVYSKWIIEGELNYSYVLLGLLELLNRYKEFSGHEHKCRSKLTNVLHAPMGLLSVFTLPPVGFLPLSIRSDNEIKDREDSLLLHRQAYVLKLNRYFEIEGRYVEFWDKIPEWIPYKQIESRVQTTSMNGVVYERNLSSLNIVRATNIRRAPSLRIVDIHDVAEPFAEPPDNWSDVV